MPVEAIDRLRRLDALFAERVLGKDLSVRCHHHDLADGDNPSCQNCGWEGTWGDSIDHTWTPRPYTRSLDAAWEGATTVGFVSLDYYFDTGKTTANVDRGPDGEEGMTGSMDHPAEALVLACLRAVGVSEEEL